MPTMTPDLVSLSLLQPRIPSLSLANSYVCLDIRKSINSSRKIYLIPQTKKHPVYISVVKLFHCIIIMYLRVFHSTMTLLCLARNKS